MHRNEWHPTGDFCDLRQACKSAGPAAAGRESWRPLRLMLIWPLFARDACGRMTIFCFLLVTHFHGGLFMQVAAATPTLADEAPGKFSRQSANGAQPGEGRDRVARLASSPWTRRTYRVALAGRFG